MKSGTTISIRGEELLLLPQRALFWKRRNALLIADVHLGKSGHFRKHGIALPSAVHHDDLHRLSQLIETSGAERIFLLGDLFHSQHNLEWNHFISWRNSFPSEEIHLIKGNHDILDEQLIHEAGLILHHRQLTEAPFTLVHMKSEENYSGFELCGHIHPAIRLSGKGRQSVSLPCFWFGKNFGVLPAFGGFTGNAGISPMRDDRVFFIVGDSVSEHVG